ncbi:hypothetical protein BOTNAR_0101g00170 [Botryotinia narcissicola]|uniref:Uncharacterized protein n=1 Tax=Botryotinia narcissicola TaxID=278944 RepID=A0A4Z1IPS9_9HELO|nr:hypothetical protein BOTNAR_0101g00170 [Botryotinia narcissicola]
MKPVGYSLERDGNRGVLYEIVRSENPAGSQRKKDKRLSKDPSQAFPEYANLREATQPQLLFTRLFLRHGREYSASEVERVSPGR